MLLTSVNSTPKGSEPELCTAPPRAGDNDEASKTNKTRVGKLRLPF